MDPEYQLRAKLQEQWMSLSESERLTKCGELWSAERKIIELQAPPGMSEDDLKEFIFYHMYGFEWPKKR